MTGITIGQSGPTDLAAQLRRLSARVDGQLLELYGARGFAFQPRWQPVVASLFAGGEASAAGLAEQLGIRHADARQLCRELTAAELVVARTRAGERLRVFALSARGKRLARGLAPLWHAIDAAGNALLAELAPDLRETLGRIEAGLDGVPMVLRVRESETACDTGTVRMR